MGDRNFREKNLQCVRFLDLDLSGLDDAVGCCETEKRGGMGREELGGLTNEIGMKAKEKRRVRGREMERD